MPRSLQLKPRGLKEPEAETWTLTLRTLTPLFGGSATPRETDRKNPVRAPSVRGHLRFWWRATAGARYGTSEALFKAEEAIWGSTGVQGKVALRTLTLHVGQEVTPSSLAPKELTNKRGPLEGFFLYPFSKTKELPEAHGLETVEFTLILRLAGLSEREREEVRTALRAWLVFGGLGARTRRGLGALEVISENRREWLPSSPKDLQGWFSEEGSGEVHHTHLRGARALLGKPIYSNQEGLTPGRQAWRALGRFWARFRKGHYAGKYPSYNPRGGAVWQDHAKLKNLGEEQSIRLAKPFLGLPLIYHSFPGADAFAGEIRPLFRNLDQRMASPVILKPVAFADGSVRAMVLVLQAPMPERIRILPPKGESGNSPKAEPRDLDLGWPSDDPVAQALEASHFREAVLEAARKEGFSEEVGF